MVLAVSSNSSAEARWRALLCLSIAELLALSPWFGASAVLHALTREWALGDAGKAGLTIAVQLGFILGTFVSALGNLPDVWPPRALMLGSMTLAALANGALALWVDSLGPALLLRGHHRRLHGGRLPTGDEGHGDLVPAAARPRHRRPDRRPHGGLGAHLI